MQTTKIDAEVREQVANTHTTNLREDIDVILDIIPDEDDVTDDELAAFEAANPADPAIEGTEGLA